jgi:hypothetical protein
LGLQEGETKILQCDQAASAVGKMVGEYLLRYETGLQLLEWLLNLGPQKFYENLRQMSRSDREQICMTGISYVNDLLGNEELKRLQRKSARFINTD